MNALGASPRSRRSRRAVSSRRAAARIVRAPKQGSRLAGDGRRNGGMERGSRRCSRKPSAWRVRLHGDRARSRQKLKPARFEQPRSRKTRDRRAARRRIVRNFIQANRSVASSTSAALVARFLPEITLAEINALARLDPIATASCSSAPEKAGVAVPDEAEARRHRQRASLVPSYVDTVRRAAAARRCRSRARSPKTTTRSRSASPSGSCQRRPGRAEADDLQAGRDALPCHQLRRDVAR